MDVCAPKDGFVAELFIVDGALLKAADPVLRMDSDSEDRSLERLATAESIRILKAAQYEGSELELLQTIAKIAVNLADQKVIQTGIEAAHAPKRKDLGIGTSDAVVMAESAHAESKLEQLRAVTQQTQLAEAIKRHHEMNDLISRQNASQKDFILRKKELLKVNAPIAGSAKLLVSKGSFAELGSVLFRIE